MAKTKESPEKPKRKPRAKQGFLPELEPPSIPEIDDAANDLADTRSRRMALTKLEGEEAETLLGLMKKHKLTCYEYDGKRVEVDSLEKIRVRKKKTESNGDDSED